MIFPLYQEKAPAGDDDNDGFIYTTGNLNARLIKPWMISDLPWSQGWALETVSLIGDPIAYLELAGDQREVAASHLAQACANLLDPSMELTGGDGLEHAIAQTIGATDSDNLQDKAYASLREQSTPLAMSAYTTAMQEIYDLANADGTLFAHLQNLAHERWGYHRELTTVLSDTCPELTDAFMYLYGAFAVEDQGYVLHVAYAGGNEIIFALQDGKIEFVRRGFANTNGSALCQAIAKLDEDFDDFAIETTLSMPFDISTWINDYDELFCRFSGK